MNERLKELRKYLGYSQREYCTRLGMAQSTYASMESGARELRQTYFKLICRSFNVNEDWLRDGSGEMFLQAPKKELEELLNIFDNLKPALQEYLLKQARELLQLQSAVEFSRKQ